MLTITSTIIIPQLDKSGNPIDIQCHLDYLTSISSMFGGYTESEGNGGWLDNSGKLVFDKVYIVTISTPLIQFTKIRSFLLKLGNIIKRDLKQDSVYVNIGHVLTYFI